MAPSPPPPLPCLVFDNGNTQPATAFSVSDGAHRSFDAEELRGKRSWPTSSGWVLAWDPATSATFLWNPSAPGATARVALPPMTQPPPADSVCALSGRPTAAGGDCTVVLVEPPESAVLWYCHAAGASASWTRHEYDLGGTSVPVSGGSCWCPRFITHLAPRRGVKFYHFYSATEYGVIEFNSSAGGPPEFSTVPMRKVPVAHPAGQVVAMASMYDLYIGGELHTVSVLHRRDDVNSVVDVKLYKMDFERQEPVRVGSIGDRAVLAGSRVPFAGWCPATEFGLLPNTVYWMSRGDKRLHVFDIGTGKKEVREVCKGVAEPSRQPFWMIPDHP